MFRNAALKSLAPQGIDLNTLIEMQANQNVTEVPPVDSKGNQFSGNNANKGRTYQKSRPYYNNSVKRHK